MGRKRASAHTRFADFNPSPLKRQHVDEIQEESMKPPSLAETLILNFPSLDDNIKQRLLNIVDTHINEDASLL